MTLGLAVVTMDDKIRREFGKTTKQPRSNAQLSQSKSLRRLSFWPPLKLELSRLRFTESLAARARTEADESNEPLRATGTIRSP